MVSATIKRYRRKQRQRKIEKYGKGSETVFYAMFGVLAIGITISIISAIVYIYILEPMMLDIYDIVMEPSNDRSGIRIITQPTIMNTTINHHHNKNNGMSEEWFKKRYFQRFPVLFSSPIDSNIRYNLKNQLNFINIDTSNEIKDSCFNENCDESEYEYTRMGLENWLRTPEDYQDDISISNILVNQTNILILDDSTNKNNKDNENSMITSPLFQVAECMFIHRLWGNDLIWYIYPPGRIPYMGFDSTKDSKYWRENTLPLYDTPPPIDDNNNKDNKRKPPKPGHHSNTRSRMPSFQGIFSGLGIGLGSFGAIPKGHPLRVVQPAGTVLYIPQGFRHCFESSISTTTTTTENGSSGSGVVVFGVVGRA